MSSKFKLSGFQAILLILYSNIATTGFFVPGEITGIINQAAWVAVIIATILAGILIYYPLASLGTKYPDLDIIRYTQKILGKPIGKLVGFLIVYYFFQLHCWTLSEYGEVSRSLLPETPLITFTIIMSLLTIYAVGHGLEVIARCGEFVFPIGMFFLIIVLFSSIPNIEVDNLQPVTEFSLPKILLASIPPLDWLSLGFVFGILSPHIKKDTNLKIVGFSAIVLSGSLLTLITLANIGVFGSSFHGYFPFLRLAEYVEIAGIDRSESLFIMYWITWVFIRAAIFSYATLMGLKVLLNLSNYKRYVIPETILAVSYSNFQYDSFIEQSYLFSTAHFYYMFFSVGLPLFIWLVSLFRFRKT